MAKAIKVNVFLTNMGDFAAMNEVYGRHFPDPKPVSVYPSKCMLDGIEKYMNITSLKRSSDVMIGEYYRLCQFSC